MKFYTVDAFTSKPFYGNPAAVVPLDEDISDRQMQLIGSEMNLSETAFLSICDSKENWTSTNKFKLRWFTPTNEVHLCGHATLASAHVIFSELGNQFSELEFSTKSGILTAKKEAKKICLQLPCFTAKSLTPDQEKAFEKLVTAVTKRCKVKTVLLNTNTKKLLVRLEDSVTREQLESIVPDFETLNTYDGSEFKGIIVTVIGNPANTGGKYDFYSRYFAPWNGIPEDPVTGSAHSLLAPYWSDVLGKKELFCRQCSRRGGDLQVSLKGDNVAILGEAVTVVEGKIRV